MTLSSQLYLRVGRNKKLHPVQSPVGFCLRKFVLEPIDSISGATSKDLDKVVMGEVVSLGRIQCQLPILQHPCSTLLINQSHRYIVIIDENVGWQNVTMHKTQTVSLCVDVGSKVADQGLQFDGRVQL